MEMDLDAALNELGMLSSVTDSRKDYLKEQAAQHKSSCFHLLQLNPAYVTCLGSSRHLQKPKPKLGPEVQEAPRSLRASGSVPRLPTDERRVARHPRSKPRYSRPYHVPRHASANPPSLTARPRRTTEPSEEERESAERENSLEASICLDSDDMMPSVVHCLTRSKSVDDLSERGNAAVHQAVVAAGVRTQHQEVELVSRHLKDLQMTSS